ncbi:CTBS [Mytilus coruscus]|uniref:CTBS n=1 Tax=Mytilus coruscus TaxID=42192 RepID=A0A6J8CE77_MYTCO|nr:CTBS [Mytilus coruscus]
MLIFPKQIKLFTLKFVVLISVKLVVTRSVNCPCESQSLCRINHFTNHREVTVITEKKSDFKKWTWEGLHNVIHVVNGTDSEDEADLMCYTHSKKANYGILVRMPYSVEMTKSDFDTWVNNSIKRAKKMYAEIIAVDLLTIVGNCHMDEDHAQIAFNFTNAFAKRVHFYNRKLSCILPWKPPCFGSNCNLTSDLINSGICDTIMTSPDSFITDCDKPCRAKATMPISNVIIGTDEYLYHSKVPVSMFYVGVPWHGYDYKCSKYLGNDEDVCMLPQKNNSATCDFQSRKKMTFYDLDTIYHNYYEKNHKWSKLYNSNYFNVNVTNEGAHQIWYDSDLSLYEKYKFALDMKLRGVVIWTVDDLVNYDQGDAQEWHWLMHNMMVTGEHKEGADMSMALKAMAIGVGCFIGGTIIGAIITTIIAKKQMKLMNRRYQPPFQKDEDDETANFHEDDRYL